MFFLGLTPDIVVLLFAWAVTTVGLADEPEATGIYLIMFPIVVVAVIWLGRPLGVVQGTAFIVWMAATALWYWPSDGAGSAHRQPGFSPVETPGIG